MIDVWLCALDGLPDGLSGVIDEAEREQAACFRHERDRRRFIARRGQVRLLLSDYLESAAEAIRFGHNDHGKPFVRDGGDLHFNVSHSDGLALIVVARGIEIGCDLERRNPALADPGVARHLFAPAEWRRFEALPPDRRIEGFFNCWTRKEAFIKAIGLGMSYPLDAFEVSLAPGDTPALLRGGEGWSIHGFTPAPGYAAAIVAAGDAAHLAGPVRRYRPFTAAAAEVPAARA